MKKLLTLLMITILIGVLVACGPDGNGPEKTKIKIWAPSEEQNILIDIVDAFKESHPEFDFNVEFGIMGVEQSITEMKKDQDVAADIFMYPSGGISELVNAQLILPISFQKEAIVAAHSTNSIQSSSLNGLLYGIPVTPNTFFLYYNQSIFTESDVLSLETMLEKELPEGTDYAFSTAIHDSWYASSFFFTAGNRLFGEDGLDPTDVDFNDSQGFKAAEYLLDLSKNPKYIEDQSGLAGEYMATGKLAAFTSGVWSADGFKTSLGENYAATKLPTIKIDGEDVQLNNFVDYKVYGVNSATKNPELATRLAIWLGNETSQMIRFETTNDAPTIKSLLQHPNVLANVEVSALLNQEQFGIPQPSNAKLADFWLPMSTFGTEIINGSVNETNLQQKLDALVAAIVG